MVVEFIHLINLKYLLMNVGNKKVHHRDMGFHPCYTVLF